MNENKEFSFLDSLNIVSLLTQLINMNEDEKQTSNINNIIKTIFSEIDKLHKENDIIIEKLDRILKKEEGR